MTCHACENNLCVCGVTAVAPEIKVRNIGALDLKNLIDSNSQVMVINVLDAHYFADCRIPGSINIPLHALEAAAKHWDSAKEIVVYCAHNGSPSAQDAFRILSKMGFAKLSAFTGGMQEWKAHNLPAEGSCRLEYLKK